MQSYKLDKKYIKKKWLVSWDYQDNKCFNYPSNLPSNFYKYLGPREILNWFNWILEIKHPDYFNKKTILSLAKLSLRYDKKLLKKENLKFDEKKLLAVGIYSAQDYLLQNFYPVPNKQKIDKILDFGAGYGRQANIWVQKNKNLMYVGMDAIPQSYCLQNLYYQNLQNKFQEYIISNSIDFNLGPGIYHLPTWRYDLLPSNFFDMIICVQVLQEINSNLLIKMIRVFSRVLKPGGMIYIRDSKWNPVHNINIEKILLKNNFVLEFKPHVINKKDIHGIPRIWRKVDTSVVNTEKRSLIRNLKERIQRIDSKFGLPLTKIYRRLSD